MIKILIAIVFVILVIVFFYIYKRNKTTAVELLKGPTSFNGTKKIVIPSIEDFDSRTQMTLEFEAKTDNLPLSLVGRDYMNVISQGDSFNILYNPENGAYVFKIFHSNTRKNSVSLLKLKNVSTQTWNKIKITIQGKKVMLFLNDTLKIAEVLPGIPLLKDRDIIIGSDISGFKGYLKNVNYIT